MSELKYRNLDGHTCCELLIDYSISFYYLSYDMTVRDKRVVTLQDPTCDIIRFKCKKVQSSNYFFNSIELLDIGIQGGKVEENEIS